MYQFQYRVYLFRASKRPVSGAPCQHPAQSIATSGTSLQLFLCEFVLVRCASSLVRPSSQYYRARRARVVTPLPSNFEVKNVGCEGLLPCVRTCAQGLLPIILPSYFNSYVTDFTLLLASDIIHSTETWSALLSENRKLTGRNTTLLIEA